MNNIIRKSATPFGALVVAVLFLITSAIIILANVTYAANDNTPKTGRLITIHDRGDQKIVLSQAATVRDVLKEASISIDAKDAVEPGLDDKLVASEYNVNIYRARPVVIIDGNTRIKVLTPYQTAKQIAKSVGIEIYDEDITTLGRTDDIMSDGAGLQLTIKRATALNFNLYGKTNPIRTQGATVGDMLAEKNVKLGEDDRVQPDLNTPVTNNLSVRVWREGKQTITVEEPISFEIEKIKDVDREVGYLNVTTPGQNGLRSVSYEVTIQDGQETNRTEIASITTLQPVKQVQVVGAKGEYTTPTENETITWYFLITNGFSKYQTAGIMGNLMQEHGFRTSDTYGGYGIVQWTGGRRLELMLLPNPDNIYTQLNFLLHELNTNYSSVKNNILASSTIDDSAIIFQNQFERCGICMEDKRVQFAYDIYATFKDRQ